MAPPARRARPHRRGRATLVSAITPPPPTNGYNLVEVLDLANGQVFRTSLPSISFRASSTLGDPVDVQVEWRTTMPNAVGLPAATYTQTIPALGSGTVQSVTPPTPLSLRTWWYRFRAGSVATGTWGAWTPADRHINVQATIGSVTSYIDLNLGVLTASPIRAAVAYSEMNVGIPPSSPLAVSYSDLNVGIIPGWRLVGAYSDLNISPQFGELRFVSYSEMNVDSTLQPDPVIWWIRPEQGKEGYVFNIYGHGFGDFQNEFDGKVRLGDLIAPIAKWERVPAQAIAAIVQVAGVPRSTPSTSSIPYLLLNSTNYVVEAGDVVEFDMRWDLPVATRLDVFPYFTVNGGVMGYGSALLSDETGDAWISDQPEAYGAWHHRRFVVPSGHYLVGKTLSNFGIGWYGSAPGSPVRTARIRSFVVRKATGAVALWVTGDDETSAPLMTYVANTGVLSSAELSFAGHHIQKGVALDPDIITPEHGWIVAIVPTGAVSAMVSVSLEED